jgi:hypothetical protein
VALEFATSAENLERLLAELSQKNLSSTAEALRAVFVGLSSGVLRAPGWPGAVRQPA